MIEVKPEDIANVMKTVLIFAHCDKGIDCFFQKTPLKIKGCKLQFVSLSRKGRISEEEECLIYQQSQVLKENSELFFNFFWKLTEGIPESDFPERISFVLLSLHWVGPLVAKKILLHQDLISQLYREQIESPKIFERELMGQLGMINSDWLDQFFHRMDQLFIKDTTKKQIYLLLRVFLEGIKRGEEPLPPVKTADDEAELEKVIKKILKEGK